MMGNVHSLRGGRLQPAIAVAGNPTASHLDLVAVYCDSSKNLYYKRGTVNSQALVTWQDENDLRSDSGEIPSVAVDSGGVIVEIHKSDSSASFYAHVGQFDASDAQKISWGPSRDTGHGGSNPSVGLAFVNTQHIAVVAFSGGSSSQNIVFMIGNVDVGNQDFRWTKLNQSVIGYQPKIAVNNLGDIVLSYTNTNGISVVAKSGQLNEGMTDIVWNGNNVTISNDCLGHSSVALADNGSLAFAYQKKVVDFASGTINYSTQTVSGTLDLLSRYMTLKNPMFGPGLGKNPSITTNGLAVVMLQEAPDAAVAGFVFEDQSRIYYSSSLIVRVPDLSTAHPGSWMADFASQTIKQLCLPGAHDAGMSQTEYCTNLASVHPTTDTITQSHDFYGMLDSGIRYFDVRPGWLKRSSTDTDPETWTGHFSDHSGGVGCLGLKMLNKPTDTTSNPSNKTVFLEVTNFLANNPTSEVVILKFSHYLMQTMASGEVDDTTFFEYQSPTSIDTFKPLITQLILDTVNTFGDWLYQKPANDPRRIVNIPLNEITNGQSKVIAIFDFVELPGMNLASMFPNNSPMNNLVRSSVYSYADYYIDKDTNAPVMSGCDLTVYDHFSNTDDIRRMVEDDAPPSDHEDNPGQPYLYNLYYDPTNHNRADLYLLSWTLTQSISDIIAGSPSIQQLSKVSNSCLGSYVQRFIQESELTRANLPNIIYVDFCDDFVRDICIFVNSYLYPPS